MAVVLTCTLWWNYFIKAKPILDHALEAQDGMARSSMARDVYSLLHFPMLCGIIAYAVIIEEAIAHASEPLHLDGRVALALGLLLFVGGTTTAVWRAAKRLLAVRLILTIITVGLVIGLAGVAPLVSLAIALGGMGLIVIIEQRMVV